VGGWVGGWRVPLKCAAGGVAFDALMYDASRSSSVYSALRRL
jgi:hypothetical protein